MISVATTGAKIANNDAMAKPVMMRKKPAAKKAVKFDDDDDDFGSSTP